jgi:hypothetical protein
MGRPEWPGTTTSGPRRAPPHTRARMPRAPGDRQEDGDASMSTPGDGTDTAAGRLHQLATYLLEHPVTGPSARTATSTTPKAPMNLGMLDYIDRSVAEVVQHTRTVNPDAGPLPAQRRGRLRLVPPAHRTRPRHRPAAASAPWRSATASSTPSAPATPSSSAPSAALWPPGAAEPSASTGSPASGAPSASTSAAPAPTTARTANGSWPSSRTNRRPSKKVSGTVQPEPG